MLLACCLAAAGIAPAFGQTVAFYSVAKEHNFVQNSSSGLGVLGYEFDVNINGAGLGGYATSLALAPESGFATNPMTATLNASGFGAAIGGYPSSGALDTAFANGSYALSLGPSSDNLNATSSLSLGESTSYPSVAPQLTTGTWSGGKLVVDAGSSYTFNFNSASFTDFDPNNSGATSFGGAVRFTIFSGGTVVATSLAVYNADTQTTAFTSFTLPAFSLTSGSTYVGKIQFSRIVDLNTFVDDGTIADAYGGTGFAAFGYQTQFQISAIPEPSTWAVLAACATLGFAQYARRRERPVA